MSSPVRIRPILSEHLGAVAEVHRAAFPESAITRAGHEATRRYYEWLLIGPHPESHTIGAFLDERLVGFNFGGRFDGALSGYLRKNRLFLASRIALRPWLLLNPTFRGRFAMGADVLQRFRRRTASAPASVKASAEREAAPYGILSIAVDPAVQGAGVGQALMRAAEAEARRRGHERMKLSVHPENTQAVRFYERGGWQRVDEDSEWNGRMIRPVSPDAT
ncbi:MAG: GNAT family N-acetyltransferase [Bacteroidota bacterium]